MWKQAYQFCGQVFFLWCIYWLGNQAAAVLHLPIPGNVLGMVLLFLLLAAGVVKVEQLELAGGFLLRHITFFFIPIAVGLMNWADLFYQHALALTVTIIVSAVAAFWVAGFVFQRLQGRNRT